MKIAGAKVLVTGASGFIASHLVHELLAQGAIVWAMVRYSNPIKCERLRDCWKDVTIVEADVRNRGAMDCFHRNPPDIVFHLAAYVHVGQSFTQIEECFDVNAKGTANVLDACQGAGTFVYQSSSEVYGRQDSIPFVETMEPKPASPYGITKYAGELYCRMRQGMKDWPRIVTVRPFNVYGPYQSSKAFIPDIILQCLSGGKVESTEGAQTREYNYISDIVRGVIACAESEKEITGPINLASGVEHSIASIVRRIASLTGAEDRIKIGALPYRPNEIWRMAASAERAGTFLGWRPTVDFEEGLKKTVEWFRGYSPVGTTSWTVA